MLPTDEQDSPRPIAARRRWVFGAAAVAAAAAGAGVAWWRYEPHALGDQAEQLFWQHSFTALSGQPMPMDSMRGRPLLVNFWATWCPPCVRELPLLSEFAVSQGERGIQVLGLAVDKAEAVARFLQRQPLQFPVALAEQGGLGLTRTLGNLQGGLPFTVLFNGAGLVQQRKIGELSAKDLAMWGQQMAAPQ